MELGEQKVWLPEQPDFPQGGPWLTPPDMTLWSYLSNVYAPPVPLQFWKLNVMSQVAETELFLHKTPKVKDEKR